MCIVKEVEILICYHVLQILKEYFSLFYHAFLKTTRLFFMKSCGCCGIVQSCLLTDVEIYHLVHDILSRKI